MLTLNAFQLFIVQRKRKMENFFFSSTIYETFSPFKVMLCFCGFWYSGKRNASLERVKIVLSVLYSLFFVTFFVMNVKWGEQEPKTIDSILLKHGWHKLYLIELVFLPIIIWSNFHHRRGISECLQLIDQYDVMCQVMFWSN